MTIIRYMSLKPLLMFVAGIGTCLVLASCGPSEKDVKSALQKTYESGYKQAIDDMGKSAMKGRSDLNAMMAARLILYSFFIVFFTLCGPSIVEWFRINAGALFKIPVEKQAEIFKSLYIAGISIILCYCLYSFGFTHSTPIVVFLAGTIWPYLSFIEALKTGDINERKSNIAKIKNLFLFCAVVIIIYSVLSEEGFMSIRLDVR
ncbi:MAG: hypothetical protein WCI51_01800 [Lentisphaerota bacterium]